jgi:hypothetical protein
MAQTLVEIFLERLASLDHRQQLQRPFAFDGRRSRAESPPSQKATAGSLREKGERRLVRPNFRELEPRWRLVESVGRASEGCLSRRNQKRSALPVLLGSQRHHGTQRSSSSSGQVTCDGSNNQDQQNGAGKRERICRRHTIDQPRQ